MGAWDYKPFDNDDACDFKDEIEECKSNKEIKKCIEKIWNILMLNIIGLLLIIY